MSNRMTRDDLLKIADLAKIKLNEEEIDFYIDNLNAIVEYAAALKNVDISGVEPMISPIKGRSTPLRKDIVLPSLSQADVLKEASQTEAGHFRVPKTIEG